MSLATAEELAAYLRRRLDEGDPLVALALDGADGVIRRYTGQHLTLVESDVLTFRGRDYGAIVLPEAPVVDVDEVTVDGEAVLTWTVDDGGVLRATDGETFADDALVEVVYTHGYVTAEDPSGSPGDPIPAELRLIAVTVAARVYHQGLVRQETVGGSSTTFSTAASTDLSVGERIVLDKFKRPGQAALEVAAGSS